MNILILCIVNVVLLGCGQMLFKRVARDAEIAGFFDIVKLVSSPFMILAIATYGVATFLWVYILTKAPLSYAYPIQALAFPLVVICSLVFFNESIPANRWIGIGIIIVGVFIASR
jgi:drug/metabolite transporter (DMT)-like permease